MFIYKGIDQQQQTNSKQDMYQAQELQHKNFIRSLQQQGLNTQSTNQEQLKIINNRTNTSDNLNNNNKNDRRNQINRNMPHYWPADHVPYLSISYCQLIQYIFAFLFFSVIIWIFWGLKHFQNQNNKTIIKSNNQQNQQTQSSNNQAPIVKNNQIENDIKSVKVSQNEFQIQFEQKMIKQNQIKSSTNDQMSLFKGYETQKTTKKWNDRDQMLKTIEQEDIEKNVGKKDIKNLWRDDKQNDIFNGKKINDIFQGLTMENKQTSMD